MMGTVSGGASDYLGELERVGVLPAGGEIWDRIMADEDVVGGGRVAGGGVTAGAYIDLTCSSCPYAAALQTAGLGRQCDNEGLGSDQAFQLA